MRPTFRALAIGLSLPIWALLNSCGGGGGGAAGSANAGGSSLCIPRTTCVLGEGCWTFVFCSGGSASKPVNQQPVAALSAPAITSVGASIALNGGASSDPNSDPLTYHWEIVSRPLGSNAAIVGSGASVSLMPDLPGRYGVGLAVDDGDLESAPAYAAILVESTSHAAYQVALTAFGADTPVSRGAVMGDLNNDGRADLVIGRDGGVVHVWLGGAAGYLGGLSVSAAAGGNSRMALADFNGDAKLDLASHNVVLAGDGSGGFSLLRRFDNMGVANLVAGDFNGDGKADLVLVDVAGFDETLRVMLGDGLGGFTQTAQFPSPVGALLSGDFNEDGIVDLVFYTGAFALDGTSQLAVMRGNAAGNFSISTLNLPGLGAFGKGDLDADGHLDIVISYRLGSVPITSATRLVVDTAVVVLNGRGDGTFVVGPAQSTPNYAQDEVHVYDFDRDGHLDVVYLGDGGQLNILRGNGAGAFVDTTIAALNPAPRSFMTAGHFDADALPDLIFAGPREMRVALAADQRF